MIDPGPVLFNPEVVTTCVNPDDPELCPDCGHATLFAFDAVALHDEGVLLLDPTTACGSEECDDDPLASDT